MCEASAGLVLVVAKDADGCSSFGVWLDFIEHGPWVVAVSAAGDEQAGGFVFVLVEPLVWGVVPVIQWPGLVRISDRWSQFLPLASASRVVAWLFCCW